MEDIMECLEIVFESQISVAYDQERKLKHDPISFLFEILKTMCNYDSEGHRV